MGMRVFHTSIVLLALITATLAGLNGISNAPTGETVQVVRVPDGGRVPDAEIDDAGTIHLVYLADANVYYVRSADQGQTFSQPIRVNTEDGFASGGRYRGPDLAIGKNGLVHVVWYNAGYQQGRPKDDWGVMYARLRPGERAFEPSRNLNHQPSDNFSLAADEDGTVAVIWMAEGVYVNRSEDEGTSFAAPLKLDADPCECCGSRALYTGEGSLVVLYRDKAGNDRDMYLALLQKGDRASTHVKLSQTPWHIEACPMTGGFLSSDREGLVASWETRGQVYFARLDERGRPLAPGEIRVADRGKYPVVLQALDGTVLVAWKHGSQLVWQRFDADGNLQGQRGSAPSDSRDRPSGAVTRTGHFLLFP